MARGRVAGRDHGMAQSEEADMSPTTHRLAALTLALCVTALAPAGEPASRPAVPAMEKYVSKDAVFLLYKPRGWVVTEGEQPTFRTVFVADPAGLYGAAMFYGTSPEGRDLVALTRRFVGGIGGQFPDFRLDKAMISRNKNRIFFSGAFTHPRNGRREMRCWVSGAGQEFLYSSVEAPEGKLNDAMPRLLTILTNVRIFKGAFATGGAAPVEVTLVPYRLSDGSASFSMPQDWTCKELGQGNFLAGDPAGAFAFIVASADVITPELGVSVPGVPVFPYLPPSRAFKTLGESQGLISNLQFEDVFPRQDVADQMATVYTAGPVTVEEFLYTCRTQTGNAKGYTFGFSFGSRLGTNWNFRHLTVMAPADRFNEFTGTFISMLQSYKIDDAWAKNYIEQGIARLRRLQQQTAQIVARNAQEIHDMMQAAYDERQKSMDYIDYQRTSYIRGEQDWISGVEGGTVYHTDSWGTKNTVTGDYSEGKPYDYVNFEGRNPRYDEQMTPINSRELWERHVR